MATTTVAVGLPADWLNGWLAAIGVTALLPAVRLSWSDEPVPHAVFHHDDDVVLPRAIYDALPSEETLQRLAIARHLPGVVEMKREVTLESYCQRASEERLAPMPSLAMSVTDLVRLRKAGDGLPHSAFDVTVPRGITLAERAMGCRAGITNAAQVGAALSGASRRMDMNGLGFDVRRLKTAPGGDVYADPVVELLAFHALQLFPVRGDGRRHSTRGWSGPASRRGSFTWAAWSMPLDSWAVDAWLQQLTAGVTDSPGLSIRYRSVPYQTSGSDVTRGYAAEVAW